MTRIVPVFCAILFCFLIIPLSNAVAFWPHYADDSLLVSPSRSSPVLSPDGQGGVVMAWVDGRVYAQRISAEGKFLWGETGIRLCSENSSQSWCDIFGDGAGGALAVWKDSRHSPLQSIYAQRIDQDGSPQWNESGALVVSMEGSFSHLRAVSDGAGGLIVTWNDFYSDDWGTYYSVRGQHLDALGQQTWAPTGVSVAGSCADYSDQLVSDNQGGAFLLCKAQTGGYTAGIFALRILASGELAWDLWDGLIVSSFSLRGTLAADGQGGCLVGYYRKDYNSETGFISVKRLGADGTSLWDYGTGIASSKERLDGPVIFPTHDHGALVGWSERIGSDSQAFAQKIAPTGERLWGSSGVAVCTASSDQIIDGVRPHDLGGAIVFWGDDRNGGPGIYAQGLDPDGAVKWPATGVPVLLNTPDFYELAACPDDDGGVILAVRDFDFGLSDIFSQRLNRRGTLGALEPVVVEVSDVPEDEGGWVQVHWYASAGDVMPASDIARYGLWRYREGMEDWELTGEIPAGGQDYYEAMIPTLADSGSGTAHLHDFRVSATTSDELETFFSAAVSGYSLNNDDASATGDIPGHSTSVEAIAPNPFNPRTVITFSLARKQPVSLNIYDARGRLVRRLLEETREAGRHSMTWDGCDGAGSPVPSGVYCCRLQSGEMIDLKKMALVR